MRFFSWFGARARAARPRRGQRSVQPRLEELETRINPYVMSGGAWVNPQLITISFVPDGTVLGYNGQGQAITSSLFHDFANFGQVSTWENQVLKAAQVWAQQTNINFAVVPDDGEPLGSGAYEQGNPNFGDIRISGFQEGAGSSYPLAFTYMPPQLNNFSIAGDVVLNTSQPFNIGSTYDLFTVAAHEIGHALGLSESNSSTAIEYAQYTGTFTGLASDDVAGIQAIYSNGTSRNFEAAANGSFTTATVVPINTTTDTAQVYGDLTTVTTNNYYEFTVPSGSDPTASISVQSEGLSLLSPKVYVYNSSHVQVAYESGLDDYGTTLTVTPSVTAGSTYYVRVIGADTTAFSTGDYALTINTGSGASPAVTIPSQEIANGTPEQSDGGELEVIGPHPASIVQNYFTLGEAVPSGASAPAAPAPDTNHAALAISLQSLSLMVTPNMAAGDVALQAPSKNVFESPRLAEALRALTVQPEFSPSVVADRIFDGWTATDDSGANGESSDNGDGSSTPWQLEE